MSERPLIAHVIFALSYGGLENGVVNLVNGLSGSKFRHVIIALTEATAFGDRLAGEVPVYALHKRPGKDFLAYVRLFRLLRKLKPAVVHTRNIGTLDCALVAFLAAVPVRIHGEHGWDIFDPDGTNSKFRLYRRLFGSFVRTFVTVSDDLRRWLIGSVRIPAAKVDRICNGVDTERFRPRGEAEPDLLPDGFKGQGNVVVGSVTRFSAIKDPLNLVEAFIRARAEPDIRASLRLVMIGDGALHEQARTRLDEAGASGAAWLPGSRDNVHELLRHFDLFVLGSLREGISNTILEAMATGLPVIATETGGNFELVEAGRTGSLVPPADSAALAAAIAVYARDRELRERQGRQARARALEQYSLCNMLERYRRLYLDSLAET